MNEEVRNDTRRTVTSVGNSWIVCKSKTHSGYVYYFNTLTGEAVWNLSDAEIEKAKSRTKHLEDVTGSKPTRCPEPKDKPPSIALNKLEPARKLFVDNTVSAQQSSVLPYSNFANNSTICSPINHISGIMQNAMINNPASVNPVCNLNSLNNPMSTFNLNPTPIYNPKVWDVPHMQQIFLAPTMAPVVNQMPAYNNDVAYNNLSQNLSEPGNAQKGSNKTYPRHYNYGQGGQQNLKKIKDLRRKLLFARQRNNIKPSFISVSGKKMTIRSNARRNSISTHNTSEVEGTGSNDGLTLENIHQQKQLDGSSSKIDLGPLKSLAPSDANSDAWYIIVDLDVLLNEFKFLNTLTDSDEQCHLMVPRRVMEELKTYVSCTENIHARRILRFLSQQIEIGYALMAAEPSKVEGESMAKVILTTCTELLENKYHLILLSNDKEILNFKDSSMVNMFSIDEVKNLLMNNPNKQPVLPLPKKTFLLDELINKIKITVPNDNAQDFKKATSPVNIEPGDIKDIPITQPQAKQKNTQDKKEELIVLKRTVDAGIQTDVADIDTSNLTDKYDIRAICNSPQNKNIMQPVTDVLNIRDKKREIKLKRRTSNQPPVPSNNSQKKQFRWRRRRNTTAQVDEGILSQNEINTNPKNVKSLQEDTLNKEINKQLDKESNDGPSTSDRNENKISEESIESRESSIYADQRISTTKENVTIEETSTSGIISNSESNADAESQDSNCNVNHQQFVNNEQFQNKSIMYEIDSITMGDYIKMKRDEWVSRFIQIMEEVLTQVLQHDPPFSHSAMPPPPWTLHEATQCVAVKFSSHQNIKVAADKLSSILFHVSDANGKITMNMSPYQYMQMYSYGLHLLVVIKVANNCEDIQLAMESLNKLLDDIRNPNKDSSTNDTFNDIIHDDSSNNESSLLRSSANSDDDNICDADDTASHGPEQDDNQKQENYNLNSIRRKFVEEELPKPVKFIRNNDIKSSYFKELNLQRVNVNKSIFERNGEAKVQANKEQHPTNSQTAEKVTDIDIATNQSKIIRNFSICPELEEKLKGNYNSIVKDNKDLDNDEDFGEYIPEEFCSNVIYNEQRNDVDETNIRTETNGNFEPESLKVVDSRFKNDDSKKFKYMMCKLLQEVRKALCQVQVLCDQCYEEFKNPGPSIEQKCQLRKMAERAHLHIIRLCRSLESMLDHETDNPTQNMCNLLKKADINICHVDEKLLFEYRTSVAKCKEHADEFLSSIESIISTFNS